MANYKMVFSSVVNGLVKLAKNKLAASSFYTDNPELIKAVTDELRATEATLVLSKLADLEKAVYHIAGKQQEMMIRQNQIEEVVVAMATSIDEMMNGFESPMNPEFVGDDRTDDDSEEEIIDQVWDVKKNATPLN